MVRREQLGAGAAGGQEEIDHGITLFDTAKSYGSSISEELLGKGLGARRKEIVLVTTIGFRYEGNRLVDQCSSFDYVVASPEGCLPRLGTDWVDLLLIHWPDHNTVRGSRSRPWQTQAGRQDPPREGVQLLPGDDGCVRERRPPGRQPGRLPSGSTGAWNGRCCPARRPTASVSWPTAPSASASCPARSTSPPPSWTGTRSKGYAFGLPLFQREQFLKQLRMVNRLRPIAARHGKSVAQFAISWVLGNPSPWSASAGPRN